jgi:hypothetical protein
MSESPPNPYAEWRRLLSLPRIDGYMDEPMAGFWRVRFGAKNEWIPFATFWSEGELVGVRFGKLVSPYEHWTRYAYNPISESVYRAVAEQGKPWPARQYLKGEYPDEQHNAA